MNGGNGRHGWNKKWEGWNNGYLKNGNVGIMEDGPICMHDWEFVDW